MQSEDLLIVHPLLMLWSAIMKPLKDLQQSTCVMMGLFSWRGIAPPGSARVMEIGLGEYPGASQVRNVVNFMISSRIVVTLQRNLLGLRSNCN